MAVTYSYDPPVGGATEIQVVFEYNDDCRSRSMESVFTDGEYDAVATEAIVALAANNILTEFTKQIIDPSSE